MPRWLAANVLSLLSTGSLLSVLALSLAPSLLSKSATAVVFFVALQIYVAGDHLDGMQAVASGTASPLGDFIDHFCDLWAGGILVYGFWSLVGTASPALLYASTALLIAAFATTYAEREKEHRLHFTRWGALEANVVTAVFFLSWTVPGIRDWWQSASPVGVPWYLLPIVIVATMAAGSMVVIVRRMKGVTAPLAIALSGVTALTLFAASRPEISPVEGWLLLLLFGGHYVARVMYGYLVPGERSWPDLIAVAGTGVLLASQLTATLSAGAARMGIIALGAYMAAMLVFAIARIFAALRRHWVWVN